MESLSVAEEKFQKREDKFFSFAQAIGSYPYSTGKAIFYYSQHEERRGQNHSYELNPAVKAMVISAAEGLDSKRIQGAHDTLDQFESNFYQIATLLHRLYYKSKAQHRSAKWFQSIGGMKKCLTRLLEMSNVVSNVYESLPDKGVNKKARASKRLRPDERDVTSIKAAKVALADVWHSLWGQESTNSRILTDLKAPPVQKSGSKSCEEAALKLLIVSIQLEELAHRSRQAFKLMQLHLRTPPAPTFAPLVITIMSICAEMDSICQKMLWDKANGDTTLPAIYSLVRSQVTERLPLTLESFQLDATSRSNGIKWSKMLRRVNQSHHKDLAWLPRNLIQPNLAMKVVAPVIPPQKPGLSTPLEEPQSEGEDLGEAL